MQRISDKKKFSIIARAKSFTHAIRGLNILIRTTHNFWLHIIFAIFAIFLGFYFSISDMEWIIVIFMIGFVFSAEAFNTAIEIDMNLTSPEFHPYAKDTKDVAAGAVLISAFISLIIGLIIFIPKIINLFFI